MRSVASSGTAYQLYQYPGCPHCLRVRWFLWRHRIKLPLRNIATDPAARQELVAGGGRPTVPCLRIERDGRTHWLYESLDIIEHLRHAWLPKGTGA